MTFQASCGLPWHTPTLLLDNGNPMAWDRDLIFLSYKNWSPPPLINTLHSVFQTNQSNNQQSNFEAVQSGKKKKKQKMVRADPSLLGFSVNASSERLNMGEIETLDDYWVPAAVPAFPLLPSDHGFSLLDTTYVHYLLCHPATNQNQSSQAFFFPSPLCPRLL